MGQVTRAMTLQLLLLFSYCGIKAEVNSEILPSVTDQVYLDITIDDVDIGRIVIGLFGEIVPKTVWNFRSLANGIKVDSFEQRLHYKSSKFHRVIKYFVVQTGDVLGMNGMGSFSAFGNASFPDENFVLDHHGAGWVAMANSGPDTGASQFYITLGTFPFLDGRFVVFGKVIKGMDVVQRIENVEIEDVRKELPLQTIQISDCGSLPAQQPFTITLDHADGFFAEPDPYLHPSERF